jgi:hypothetical protein
VVGGLNKAHTRRAPVGCTIKRVLHKAPSDAEILGCRVNRDRPDPPNCGTFVHEIAAHDIRLMLRNHRVKFGVSDQPAEHTNSNLDRRKVPRKAMAIGK